MVAAAEASFSDNDGVDYGGSITPGGSGSAGTGGFHILGGGGGGDGDGDDDDGDIAGDDDGNGEASGNDGGDEESDGDTDTDNIPGATAKVTATRRTCGGSERPGRGPPLRMRAITGATRVTSAAPATMRFPDNEMAAATTSAAPMATMAPGIEKAASAPSTTMWSPGAERAVATASVAATALAALQASPARCIERAASAPPAAVQSLGIERASSTRGGVGCRTQNRGTSTSFAPATAVAIEDGVIVVDPAARQWSWSRGWRRRRRSCWPCPRRWPCIPRRFRPQGGGG